MIEGLNQIQNQPERKTRIILLVIIILILEIFWIKEAPKTNRMLPQPLKISSLVTNSWTPYKSLTMQTTTTNSFNTLRLWAWMTLMLFTAS